MTSGKNFLSSEEFVMSISPNLTAVPTDAIIYGVSVYKFVFWLNTRN